LVQQEGTTSLDDILSLVSSDRVTHSTLVAIQSAIEDYWRRDDQHGGAPLRPAVVGQLRHVVRLLGITATGDLRCGLQSVATELARLAGWAYFDARQYSTARSYFTQALQLARETGDRQFAANILSCLSLQATYEGDVREAVDLACAAQDAARDTAPAALVMSMLHMREAFAHASLRDASACHKAITKAHNHFELPDRRLLRSLPLLDQPHGQLPCPRVRDETVAPHHQHPLLIIDDSGHSEMPHPHDVMLPPAAVGLLNVHQPQVDPWVAVDLPLTVDLPLHPSSPFSA
jgi:hypothetical protein